jgi:hypothetical protein
MSDLIERLEAQNDLYWRVRNRVMERQQKLSISSIKKDKCRYETRKLIKAGEIQVMPCEVCGSKKTQVHHLDYEYPAEILFLCEKHHRNWHRENDIH